MTVCAILLHTIPALSAVTVDLSGGPADIGRSLRGLWTFIPHDDRRVIQAGYTAPSGMKVNSFPHDWKSGEGGPRSESGIAWYRLDVFLAGSTLPKGDLILRLGPVNDADETWFNGVKIGATGAINPDSGMPDRHGWDRVRLYRVPASIIKSGSVNVIAVRVQNYFPSEAGFRTAESTVILGPEEPVLKAFYRELLPPMAVFAAICSAGLYFLLGWLRGPGNPANLFLSVSCLAAALYFGLKTQVKYLVADSFITFKRIEYAVVIAAMFLFMDYLYFLFSPLRRRTHRALPFIMAGINCIALAAVVPVLASGNILFWDRYMNTVVEPLLILPAAMSFYILITGLPADKKAASVVLAGFTVCVAAVFHDILVHRALLQNEPLSQWPFLIFVIILQQVAGRGITRNAGRKSRPAVLTDKSGEKIEAVMAYLEKNYVGAVSREALAARYGMSADHLSRTFRAYTGMKITEYINSLRVEYAKSELACTDRPVIGIALDAGFESLRNFNRVFSRMAGMTPSTFRSRHPER